MDFVQPSVKENQSNPPQEEAAAAHPPRARLSTAARNEKRKKESERKQAEIERLEAEVTRLSGLLETSLEPAAEARAADPSEVQLPLSPAFEMEVGEPTLESLLD